MTSVLCTNKIQRIAHEQSAAAWLLGKIARWQNAIKDCTATSPLINQSIGSLIPYSLIHSQLNNVN